MIKNKHSYLTDDKGNISNLRMMLTILFANITQLSFSWSFVFIYVSITRPNPDYTGLGVILGIILGNSFIGLIGKVMQKKIEMMSPNQNNQVLNFLKQKLTGQKPKKPKPKPDTQP